MTSTLATVSTAVRAAIQSLIGQAAGAAAIASALDQAREMERLALAEVEAAEAEHADAVRKFDRDRGLIALARRNEAGFDLEAARMAIASFEAEAAAEAHREDQARRQASYDAAKAELEAAEKALCKSYPKLARQIVDLLERVARADVAAKAANADAPEGATPLDTVGFRRFNSAEPRIDLKEEFVALWVHLNGTPIPEDRQKDVLPLGVGRGELPSKRDGAMSPNPPITVELRRFRKTTYLPALPTYAYDGFANVLALPGFAHEAPIWTPAYSDDPAVVLQHIERVQAYAEGYCGKREPLVDLTPVGFD